MIGVLPVAGLEFFLDLLLELFGDLTLLFVLVRFLHVDDVVKVVANHVVLWKFGFLAALGLRFVLLEVIKVRAVNELLVNGVSVALAAACGRQIILFFHIVVLFCIAVHLG